MRQGDTWDLKYTTPLFVYLLHLVHGFFFRYVTQCAVKTVLSGRNSMISQFRWLCVMSYSLLMLPASLCAQPDMDIYSIADITVNQTAENPDKAQQAAYFAARKRAWEVLSTRLLGTPHDCDDDTLGGLILSHRIVSEKMSSTTYHATYHFQFLPAEVDTYLGIKNRNHSQQWADPTIIIPIFDKVYPPLSFHEENPWLRAWQAILPFSRSPLIIPEGDAQDLVLGQDIIDPLKRNMGIQGLYKRYPGKHVAVVTFRPQNKAVHLQLYNEKTAKIMDEMLIVMNTDPKQALTETIERLNKWFGSAPDKPSAQALDVFQISVHYKTIGQLLPLCQCLGSMRDAASLKIPRLSLSELTQTRALFSLSHINDVTALKAFFESRGFQLRKTAAGWTATAHEEPIKIALLSGKPVHQPVKTVEACTDVAGEMPVDVSEEKAISEPTSDAMPASIPRPHEPVAFQTPHMEPAPQNPHTHTRAEAPCNHAIDKIQLSSQDRDSQMHQEAINQEAINPQVMNQGDAGIIPSRQFTSPASSDVQASERTTLDETSHETWVGRTSSFSPAESSFAASISESDADAEQAYHSGSENMSVPDNREQNVGNTSDRWQTENRRADPDMLPYDHDVISPRSVPHHQMSAYEELESLPPIDGHHPEE